MSHSLTPREFASRNVAIVRQLWNGVRDGDVESIHQARIATRRVRAALSALGHADAEQLDVTKQLGRALGRVRELDATEELLRTLGARVPVAVSAIAVVLRDLERDGARARHRLIKTLEDLNTRPLLRLHRPERLSSLKFWKDWRAELHAELASKADSVRNAVDHASAVYMPNRLHRVRIALKKLRYALEIAEAAGMHVNAKATRDARKLQDVLGRMRDLHLAGRLVERFSLNKQFADETRVLMAVIAFERSALHARYVSRRDDLKQLCDYSAGLATAQPIVRAAGRVLRALPAAGVAALPIAVWQLQSASHGVNRPPPVEAEAGVRIAVGSH